MREKRITIDKIENGFLISVYFGCDQRQFFASNIVDLLDIVEIQMMIEEKPKKTTAEEGLM